MNGTSELAGPEQLRLDELVRDYLAAKQDPRQVAADEQALYFGARLNDQSLVPGGPQPRIATTTFGEWGGQTLA
ncbi:hypothetical protein D3C80_1586580 [compost metagenome]